MFNSNFSNIYDYDVILVINGIVALFLSLLLVLYHKLYLREAKELKRISSNLPGALVKLRLKSDGSLSVMYLSKDPCFMNKNFMDCIHPEDLPKLLNLLKELSEKGESGSLVYRSLLSNRLWGYMEITLTAERISAKEPLFYGYLQDVTEKYYVERALKFLATDVSKLTYNDAFFAVCEWIGENLGLDYVFIGKVQNGKSVSVLTGWSRFGEFEPFEYHLEGTPCAKTVEGYINIVPENVVRLYPKDEKLKRLNVESYVGRAIRYDPAGVVGLLVGLGTTSIHYRLDMVETIFNLFTEALALEFVRIEEENRKKLITTIFQASSDIMFLTDSEGRILEVNSSFEEATGYSKDEVLGKKHRVFYPNSHKEGSYEAFIKSLKEKGHWEGIVHNRKKSGELYVEGVTVDAVYDENGKIANYVIIARDMTHYYNRLQEMREKLYRDALTGAYNRLFLKEVLAQAIARSKREHSLMGVLYMDLDKFKPINDTYGHEAGDRVLVEIVKRVLKTIRETDYIVRVGGDEFVVVISDINVPENVDVVILQDHKRC